MQPLLRTGFRSGATSLTCWRTPFVRRSDSAASPCWSSPATSRCDRRPSAAFHPNAGLLPAVPVVRPAEARIDCAGRPAERRQARDAVLRPRLRRRPCQPDEARGGAQKPDRACARRQGLRRIRQPLRRRHDRVHRLFLRLCRHARLRRAADAGNRFSLQAVSPRPTPRSPRSTSARKTSAGAASSISASSATSARPSRRCCRSLRRKPSDASRRQPRALQEGARRASTNWPAARPGNKPIHPQYLARGAQRGGRRRCRLHGRCRHAYHLGGALSGDERPPASGRVLGSWLDGQRHGRRRSASRQRSPAARWCRCRATADLRC